MQSRMLAQPRRPARGDVWLWHEVLESLAVAAKKDIGGPTDADQPIGGHPVVLREIRRAPGPGREQSFNVSCFCVHESIASLYGRVSSTCSRRLHASRSCLYYSTLLTFHARILL